MGASFIAAWASAILESVPFVLGAAVIAHLPLPRLSRMVPFLDCGCGAGPSARSLPGAAATCLVFGAPVAALRFAAATVAGRGLRATDCARDMASPLQVVHALLAPSFFAASLQLFASQLLGMYVPPVAAAAIGAVLAFVSAPCALATPAIAAVLRSWSPAASIGFLCVAGICDLRTVAARTHSHGNQHDCLAYALLACVCALAAFRNGGQLVTPLLTTALVGGALVCIALLLRYRTARAPRLRFAPALMLGALFVTTAPPQYYATETTLANAFPGERIDFTGIATQMRGATTIVRYAIVCCRADATPVAVRLEKVSPALHGWVHVAGDLVQTSDGLALRIRVLSHVAAPADPFVYR